MSLSWMQAAVTKRRSSSWRMSVSLSIRSASSGEAPHSSRLRRVQRDIEVRAAAGTPLPETSPMISAQLSGPVWKAS